MRLEINKQEKPDKINKVKVLIGAGSFIRPALAMKKRDKLS
jgi:hypothetical protein